MSLFQELLALPPAELKKKGVGHTVAEILQQPQSLVHVVAELAGRWDDLRQVRGPLVFCGAGSSAHVGEMLVPLARVLGRDARAVPTTDAVSHPSTWLGTPDAVYVSFARSGDSPESLAVVDLLAQLAPRARQVGITCNPAGQMTAKLRDLPGALVLIMPPETNDLSLAMTSSVSAMYAAGLALLYADRRQTYETLMTVGSRLLQGVLDRFGDRVPGILDRKPNRVQYLGSGVLSGVAHESRLKMQEMTAGRIVTQYESYLGLRHGPQVFVDPHCLVVADLSADRRSRAYEVDLLRELRSKKQGLYVVAVCDRDDGSLGDVADEVFAIDPEGILLEAARKDGVLLEELDAFLVPSHLAVGQMLATVASMNLGLSPDAPSEQGIIHRVVQGVSILPWTPRSVHESGN